VADRCLPSFPTRRSSDLFDGHEMRHYVDGKLELAGPLRITPLGKGRTSIGVRQNKVYWFKGAIGTIHITPKALTPSKFHAVGRRSEEHTSELQSRSDLVC